MIGRNGHMRWPEILLLVRHIWQHLPAAKRWNAQFGRQDDWFENWDCSLEGYEGIRSQDIMPLLQDRFVPVSCAAWGGLTDVFVDRGYGPNYDPEDSSDREFVSTLWRLERELDLKGLAKPSQVILDLASPDNRHKSPNPFPFARGSRCTHRTPPDDGGAAVLTTAESYLSPMFASQNLTARPILKPTIQSPSRVGVNELPADVLVHGWAGPGDESHRWAQGEQSRLRFRTGGTEAMDVLELVGVVAQSSPLITVTLRHVSTGRTASAHVVSGTTFASASPDSC